VEWIEEKRQTRFLGSISDARVIYVAVDAIVLLKNDV